MVCPGVNLHQMASLLESHTLEGGRGGLPQPLGCQSPPEVGPNPLQKARAAGLSHQRGTAWTTEPMEVTAKA